MSDPFAVVRLFTTVFTPATFAASLLASSREPGPLTVPLSVTVPLFAATEIGWPCNAESLRFVSAHRLQVERQSVFSNSQPVEKIAASNTSGKARKPKRASRIIEPPFADLFNPRPCQEPKTCHAAAATLACQFVCLCFAVKSPPICDSRTYNLCERANQNGNQQPTNGRGGIGLACARDFAVPDRGKRLQPEVSLARQQRLYSAVYCSFRGSAFCCF